MSKNIRIAGLARRDGPFCQSHAVFESDEIFRFIAGINIGNNSGVGTNLGNDDVGLRIDRGDSQRWRFGNEKAGSGFLIGHFGCIPGYIKLLTDKLVITEGGFGLDSRSESQNDTSNGRKQEKIADSPQDEYFEVVTLHASPDRVELSIFPLGRDCSIQLSYGDSELNFSTGLYFSTPPGIYSRGMLDLSLNKKRTHYKGLVGELKFALHLLENGWEVFQPIDQNSRADFVILKGGRFKKIQVKYCSPYKGCLRVELEHPKRKTGPYQNGEIDDIAVYNPSEDKFYLVPLRRFGSQKEVWFRVDKAKKDKGYKINWISSYEV